MAKSKQSGEPGEFLKRHIGPSEDDLKLMLARLEASSLDDFVARVVPSQIRQKDPLSLSHFATPLGEREALGRAKELAEKNKVFRSFIGMGYSETIVPAVIQRNILENPGWYTQYTPYQPEISQGRLEALLNFQTLITELTGLPVANASLLDEGTAAAEAMAMSFGIRAKRPGTEANTFVVFEDAHPQTIDILKTRAEALGIQVKVLPHSQKVELTEEVFGVYLQYPNTYGSIHPFDQIVAESRRVGALVTMGCDLMALLLLRSPGELGADIAVGNSQRFGVPLGFGGPHAAFLSTKDEYKRVIPGRLVGVSKDSKGRPALRLALQTREQHIRREKATSNICTAQVLLAVISSFYAVYHGPKGLRLIAERIHSRARELAGALLRMGYSLRSESFFDTLVVNTAPAAQLSILEKAYANRMNLRPLDDGGIGISLAETTSGEDVRALLSLFADEAKMPVVGEFEQSMSASLPADILRRDEYLTQEVFSLYHSETEFLRYVKKLESRDLSLAFSMIPLGSCTMKLNATTEMLPVTWESFGNIHPFAPLDQSEGYQELFRELQSALCEITGFDDVSLQPNAGSQGEYAGLLAIQKYHRSQGDAKRDICLIPRSAHGTNPASAIMAGMKVVAVDCDDEGNIDLGHLREKSKENAERLAALMITYPSTHGVFEEKVKEVCDIIHSFGGQVYLDGANLNALLGLCKPAEIGADVCHINLHKTFCIPHGGGGPGMGPIGVKKHLVPFLPGHSVISVPNRPNGSAVSAAPWGSPSILPISWMYIMMMGERGLTLATEIAILNANYVAKRLEKHFPILYRGKGGLVAHECILDLREFKQSCGIEVEDVAKRLIDYGFHAPTVSWPVAGTLMVEPTESESLGELDRFCDAMIAIREEIRQVESGEVDRTDNPLKNAPHTARDIAIDKWSHSYSREKAAYPADWTHEHKFWPVVSRIDGAYGDRNLICTCSGLMSGE